MYVRNLRRFIYVSSAGSTQSTASLVSTQSCVTISQPSIDTSQEKHTLGRSAWYWESVGVHNLHPCTINYTHIVTVHVHLTTGSSTQPTVSLVSTPSSFAMAEPTATHGRSQVNPLQVWNFTSACTV